MAVLAPRCRRPARDRPISPPGCAGTATAATTRPPRVGPTGMVRAVLTEDGPATFAMSWSTGTLEVEAWGPGAGRAAADARRMAALDRRPPPLPDVHPVVTAAARRFPGLWAGASGDLYHALLPSIIAQRITSGEAIRQWSRLCRELGEPAARTRARARPAAAPRPTRRPTGVVVPPPRHRGQTGAGAHRGRPGRPPAVGVGPAARRRRRRQARTDPRGRTVDGRLGPRPRLRRRRCGRGRRLPPAEHRQLEPRRRATSYRRPYARPPRTVPRPARPGRPAARARPVDRRPGSAPAAASSRCIDGEHPRNRPP